MKWEASNLFQLLISARLFFHRLYGALAGGPKHMMSRTESSAGMPSSGFIACCAFSCPIAVTHQTLYPRAAAARCADMVAAATLWSRRQKVKLAACVATALAARGSEKRAADGGEGRASAPL